jgi:hypothetical protein
MTFALPFLTGFALGAFAVFALVVLLIVLANRPQTTKAECLKSPTFDDEWRMRWNSHTHPETPHPPEDIAQGEGINYQWINLTGEEK